MFGKEIELALVEGLKNAGIDGRITGVDMEMRTNSMPIRMMGGMVIDQIVTGNEITMIITLALNSISLKKQGPTFSDIEFEVRPRVIAKPGENV